MPSHCQHCDTSLRNTADEVQFRDTLPHSTSRAAASPTKDPLLAEADKQQDSPRGGGGKASPARLTTDSVVRVLKVQCRTCTPSILLAAKLLFWCEALNRHHPQKES